MSAEKPKVSASVVVVGAVVSVVAIVMVGARSGRGITGRVGCVGVFWVCLYAGWGGNVCVFVKKYPIVITLAS